MTVKNKVGRRRYIAFRIENPSHRFFSRSEVISALNSTASARRIKAPLLTVFDAQHSLGIVRVRHTEKEKAIELLNTIKKIGGREVKVVTLRTSGTIKTLRERYNLPASKRRKKR